MATDYKNINQIWAAIAVVTLKRLGLKTAVICPGSRSTPLTMAFVEESPHIELISILDERSAAFFALGKAKITGLPTVLVCTSGTAGANFYPAVIEAKESRVPLIILTADRPPELRDCHSGQTIDQVKLYGDYVNWQTELATPIADIGILRYVRQMLTYGWERALSPVPGVVHINVPLRDPLPPIPHQNQLQAQSLELLKSQFQLEEFLDGVTNTTSLENFDDKLPILPEWQQCDRGIIIAGVAQPLQVEKYCLVIAQLAKSLQYPVLAEGLSPVRNYAEINPYIISTYDSILRNPQLAHQLTPQIVIQVGDTPTSKQLRQWLSSISAQRWVIDHTYQNLDPLHGKTIHLRCKTNSCAYSKLQQEDKPGDFLKIWLSAETQVRQSIDNCLMQIEDICEVKLAWFLSQNLPPETPIFIANSMPVRDVEFFWKPNNSHIIPYFNRGANGIDGTLSTALGTAHRQQGSVMLTGDLALLHDTNGFLLRNKFVGHLTIILINNNGGGIFEMLPIAEFNPPFEEFFATPQDIDFHKLCATYGVKHELITSWQQLGDRLQTLSSKEIRVLEIRTNRHLDANWRKENLGKFAI
ncbi:2-succinyl-5-enolpyruvyl-6-hydroxy-3-cyclohexene-1-carboxylic-acid synthase [Richelia intracellularis]|nr:2-succinyl-5-enolpyruvyl-6-hydroxy-3-cyclohexene-1-carboxylic-acid synthase [Richelia intracellularis]